eukprot:TRINITY_DN29009_c0_g1_i4.p1 TRINITY_DN29009_c0_g1~~TRINITY_DN29009_c0_g1_i4.p1  ORF type:complete len:679 (-),score=141.10 TRINITY_DN29009_c0_g1_i4:148-2106(-)
MDQEALEAAAVAAEAAAEQIQAHLGPSSKPMALRACNVHAAPRLPSTLAESLNPILKSGAEDLKFGHVGGREAPGRAKVPSAFKKPEAAPPAEEKPKRPAVPRFRHPAPKQPQAEASDVTEGDEGQSTVPQVQEPDVCQQSLERNEPGDADSPSHARKTSQPWQPRSTQPRRQQPRQAQQSRKAEGPSHASQPEGKLCEPSLETCGGAGGPGHAERCELRPAECRYCGQKLALATRGQHERTCPERPIAQDELRGREAVTSGPRSRCSSAASTRGRTSSRAASRSRASSRGYGDATPRARARNTPRMKPETAAKEASKVPQGLREGLEQYQQYLDAATRRAMLEDCDDEEQEGSGSVESIMAAKELESGLEALVQQLSSSDLSRNQSALALMAQLQATPTQQLSPLDHLVDLQRRFSIFKSALRFASGEGKPPGPAPVAPKAPGGRPATGSEAASAASLPATPRRRNMPGQHLPPLQLTKEKLLQAVAPPSAGSRASSRAESLAPRGLLRSSSRASSCAESVTRAGLADSSSRASSPGRAYQPPGRRAPGSCSRSASAQGRSGSRLRRQTSTGSIRSNASSRRSPRSSSRLEKATRQQEPPAQQLRSNPGPAAVGYREVSLEEMKTEIEEERQRYIAQRLQALANLRGDGEA